jgi:hypothetical protein
MKKKDREPPLRKIIEIVERKEILECGHVLPIKQDIFGDTCPLRRRCWKCLKDTNSVSTR